MECVCVFIWPYMNVSADAAHGGWVQGPGGGGRDSRLADHYWCSIRQLPDRLMGQLEEGLRIIRDCELVGQPPTTAS